MNIKILKISRYSIAFLFLLSNFSAFAQVHRYERFNGPRDWNIGLKYLLIGGVVWGIGMLLGLGLKKNERGNVKDGQNMHFGIVGVLCVVGMLIAAVGLIMFGF
jgi:hypothetical protein